MNIKSLKSLLNAGESETVEFKEEISDSLFKAISALSNKKGGTILLGVNKKGEVTGVSTPARFLENLTNRIVDITSTYPSIEILDAEGKKVVVIELAQSPYPVSCEGRYYERIGDTSREMRAERLRAFLLKGRPWDFLTGDFPEPEIDGAAVENFLRRAVETGRLPDISLKTPIPAVLEKLEGIKDGKLTFGALLLFGKEPHKRFMNACIRVGRFKSETEIIDDKWVRGNLFDQLEGTLKLLKQYISVSYSIKGLEREDRWEYPLPVLREAVLNAIVHRDYHDAANFIQIKVYDDRIWLSNPGGLPEGITVEDLKRPHRSHLRNPLIAKAFYLAGMIEQFGSGTMRMAEWMSEAGLPEPEFREEMGGFSVYFEKSAVNEEALRAAGLNERQVKAVLFVRKYGRITNEKYRTLTGVGRVTAFKELNDLVKIHILIRVGTTGKNIFYSIGKKPSNARNAQQTLSKRSTGRSR